MAESVTWDIKVNCGAGLESIKQDCRFPLQASWGIMGTRPTDRVASTGNLNAILDNSQYNSAGSIGYYTPGHSNAKAGFDLGGTIQIMVGNGVDSRYKNFYISDVAPDFGIYGNRASVIVAQDFMGRFSQQFSDGLQVMTDSTVDAAMGSILALLPIQPGSVELSAGVDTLDYIFHDIDARRSSLLNAAQRLVQSDFGYLFHRGDATDIGGALVYQTRHDRILDTPAGTISNTMRELRAHKTTGQVYTSVSVICQPVELGTTDEVAYTLQSELYLAGGASKTIRCRFRDPAGGAQRVRIAPGDGAVPVADTDYKMSSTTGGGNDLNASLDITIAWYADFADVTFANTSGQGGYINLFTLKGLLMRVYDTVEIIAEADSETIDEFGLLQLRLTLPYMGNAYTATDFANHVLNKWSAGNATMVIEAIEIMGNASPENLSLCVNLDVGSRVAISEAMTGIDGEYTVNGVNWIIEEGGIFSARYVVESSLGSLFWFLGTSGYSEFGETTYLGF